MKRQALGGQAAAQPDGGYGQARHRDHRAGHGPEGDAGHDAPTEDADALQREDDPGQHDEHPDPDQHDPSHQDGGVETPAFRPRRKRRSTSIRMSVRSDTFNLSRMKRAPAPPSTEPRQGMPWLRGEASGMPGQ